MYCDKRLSSLFFSLFLSHERISLLFSRFCLCQAKKFIPRPPVIKIQRNSVLMRIFLFFLQAQKRSKRREKDTNARSHSHHHHSSSHFFISSRVVTPPTPTKTHRTTITLPLLLRDFLRFHTGRERESVCVCVRERERRSLSESERRVCSFYACGL